MRVEAVRELPSSRYFVVHCLTDGVYLAVSISGSGSLGNAGIVDLGDQTLIFDTMLTLSAARDLRSAAERLTGRAPRYVVNSHFHADHVNGNVVFPEATVISTGATAPLITQHTAPLLTLLQERGAELDAKARAEAATATDPAVRLDMEQQNDDFFALMQEASETTLRLPEIRFDGRLDIQGTAREARLLTWGGGHTPSDAVLYLPAEQILFTGDLIFHHCHPSLNYGDPFEWLRILGEMEQLEAQILAPGHGVATSRAAIAEQRTYLETLLALVRQARASGQSVDEVAALPVPAPYRKWGFASGFTHMMRALYAHQAAHAEGAGDATTTQHG